MHDRPRSFGRNASSLRAVRDEPVFLALDQRHLPIIAYFRRSTAVSFTAMLSGSLRTRRTSFLGRKGCEFIFARVLCPADKNHWVTRCSATNSPTRSDEHTSDLQSLMSISYAVFYLYIKKMY